MDNFQQSGAQPSQQMQQPPRQQKFSFNLDSRTLASLKWSAVANAVSAAIGSVFNYASLFFIGGLAGKFLGVFGGAVQNFNFEELIGDAIWGAIYGAVAGFLISKFYTQIQELNRNKLKGRLNTFFKLLFYPSVVVSVLAFFMTSVVSFAFGLLPFAIIFAGAILGSYAYAKIMVKYVGQMYPPPI